MNDAHGNLLKVGDVVQHIHSPLKFDSDKPKSPENDPRSCHLFYGTSPILSFTEQSVVVEKRATRHIPVHLACLVEKV